MKDRLLSKTPPVDYFSVRVADDRGACAHPVIPVLAERGGTQLQAPRPTENSIPSIYLASGDGLLESKRGRYHWETTRYPDWKTCASWSARISRTWSIRARLSGLPSSSVSS
jgi:hypothetical protein